MREIDKALKKIANFTGTGDPPLERVESCDLFLPDNLLNLPQLMYGVCAMGRLLVEQVSIYGQTDILTNFQTCHSLCIEYVLWADF